MTWITLKGLMETEVNAVKFVGIADSLRGVICEVFEDLSDIIQLRENLTPCGEYATFGQIKILIKYDETLRYPILATGSPLYSNDVSVSQCDEIQLNRAYSKINGGKTFSLSGYDGLLFLNHQDTFANNLDTLKWHIDTGSSPTSQEFDLYSIVLHEALHILAFESRILSDGSADAGYFSLWDNQIYTTTEYNSEIIMDGFQRLLVSDCLENCWNLNEVTFNRIEDFTAASLANCDVSGTLDFVIGQGIAPLSGGPASPNAFSHLADSCNGAYVNYVMQPGIKRGVESERRIITNPEKDILCLLGYKLNSCDGCFMTASKENIHLGVSYYNTCCNPTFTGCVDDTFAIKFSDLLCNDFTDNGSELEISDWSSSNSNISIIANDTAFLIISKIQDSYDIKYTVKGCDCRLLTSQFTVFTVPCVACSEISTCENLVCTDGFEEFTSNVDDAAVVMQLVQGAYWVHDGSQGNTPDVCRVNGNTSLHIYGNVGNPEGVAFKLNKSIPIDCVLKINLDASCQSGSTSLLIQGSKMPPCSFLDTLISNECVQRNCGDYIYNPVCIATVEISNSAVGSATCPTQLNLQAIAEIEWPNSSGDSINYIIISPSFPIGYNRSVFLDNVVVTSSCLKPCFSYNYVEDCNDVEFQPCQDQIGYSHLWHFGDGDSTTTINPNHLYTSIDTFLVTHIVSDTCENKDTSTLSVIINGDGATCCPDTTISSTTAWDSGNLPHEGRFHTITVERGVAFTINDDVELQFCDGGALIIEAGAYVDLEGDLTSYGEMTWKGVYVSGDSTLSQGNNFHSDGFNGLQQGSIQTRTGSSISNAEIGIRNYGKEGSSTSGGMVRCFKTLFKNNGIGVDFIEYQNFYIQENQSLPLSSLASFTSCKFYTDSLYQLQSPFYAFVQLSKIDGPEFKACKFVNSLLLEIPSQYVDFGFGIHSVDAEFKVHPNISTGGVIGPCPSPCTLADSTLFSGLGHGVYIMTEMQTRPYSIYHTVFENCFRGITDMTLGGGTILYNTFKLGEVPDLDFSYGQIGAEFHFAHSGFTIEENLFVVPGETEVIPIGILANKLGEFDNEIRRNTFIGLVTANQAIGENGNTSTIFPSGLRYFCNNFQSTHSEGYDFHIPNTPALDVIHSFQTPGSSQGANFSAGNHFAYSAQDFMNYGEGDVNYWYHLLSQNEDPRDAFTFGISDFQGDSNLCSISYCAPPCLEDIDSIKDDFYTHISTFHAKNENYLQALLTGNSLKIDTARSKALYFHWLSSRDAFRIVQHLMIDTIDYNIDSLITWLGHLDTYGGEVMIAGEFGATKDYISALDVLETISSSRELSSSQLRDLENLISIYSLLETTTLQSITTADKSVLRFIAYQNEGIASGVARALLSYFKEYIPLPFYDHEQIRFRGASHDSNQTFVPIVDESHLKIYPNPSGSDIFIDWAENEFNCISLSVFSFYGQKESQFTGELTSPFLLKTENWSEGVHWIIAHDKSGKSITGKVIFIQK